MSVFSGGQTKISRFNIKKIPFPTIVALLSGNLQVFAILKHRRATQAVPHMTWHLCKTISHMPHLVSSFCAIREPESRVVTGNCHWQLQRFNEMGLDTCCCFVKLDDVSEAYKGNN